MSGVTLVCFAVRQEARPFLKATRGRRDLHVITTGIGARNAERSIKETFQSFRPIRVFTCGFAGALNLEFQIADVLFDRATKPDELAAKLLSAGAKPATFVCTERIAVTVADKATLRASTYADAVEMESGVIQRLCAEARVPCVTLRAISDLATENLPLDFNALLTREQKFSYPRLFVAMMQSPCVLPALARLGKNSALAASELSRVLRQVL